MRSHTGVSPSGKATDSDSVIRRFESYYPCHYDPLAQLAEHLTFNQGVPSSNLVSRSIHSSIAQSVEQSAVNRSVVGSSPTRGANFISWPVGQAVKTPPFHGGIPGSIPGRVTTWTISSAGRAPALQAGCRQFDPVIVHQAKAVIFG